MREVFTKCSQGVCLAVGLVLLVSACGASKKKSGVEGSEAQAVAVYPLPGTLDASPRLEISFRGVAPDQLKGVTVVGRRSGAHRGRMEAHSDGLGGSFVPSRPFVAGERVTVKADLPLLGARKGAVSFRIARPPGHLNAQEAFPDGSRPLVPGANTYRSRPDLHPPAVKVTKGSSEAAPGYLFMAPKGGPGQNGPLIFDDRGRIVWFHPMRPGFKSYDFRTAEFRGRPVLTWWQGKAPGAYGGGTGLIVGPDYRVIATVKGGNGYPADIHEFRLTPKGTALIVAYVPVRWDVSKLGGPKDGALLDSIAMEVDVKTGHVLFEWHSLGHIALQDSYSHHSPGSAVDYTHLNSVALDHDGNMLISARNASTVYKVDRATGKILWRLGGKRSTFPLKRSERFVGQHDFTRDPDGNYSLFDNGSVLPPPSRPSRGLVFAINAAHKTAKLVHVLPQPRHRGTFSQGSVQPLPGNHYVVGWGGGNPELTEFTAAGKVLFDAHLLTKVESYRAYRFDWHGQPQRAPDVRAVTRKGRTVVYASWNGATDIDAWQVLAGKSRGAMQAVTRAPWRGFETVITLPTAERYVSVRGLDDAGKTLVRSRTVAALAR